tara:strand:- start:1594 stop:2439 length:846 start_codon:yes stop_codon:yes gene_type:complete
LLCVVNDPRAPRLAAAATLSASILVLATAVNLLFGIVGEAGFGTEEGAALLAVLMLLIVANVASKQRYIPELTSASKYQETQDFATLIGSRLARDTSEVNPTTASILNSILGTQQHASTEQVNAAIGTLSTGEFGAEVQRTMEAIELANMAAVEQNQPLGDSAEEHQEQRRALVQAVPLPGQTTAPDIDERLARGLDPDRVFVTEGVASVPLPTASTTSPTKSANARGIVREPEVSSAPTVPEMPDLSELLNADSDTGSPTDSAETVQQDLPELPNLDDLF